MIKEYNSTRAFPITRLKQLCAYLFIKVALIFLLIAFILFIWMWIRAYIYGEIPNMNWGEYQGNHGPWRHIYTLRDLWWYTAYAQIFSFYLASVSFLLKRDNKAAVIIFLAFVAGLFLMSTYWLVD